ncbi:MAG: metallophosphoesterase [Clostridia bacterium]|nr:metallophosphoesterase [Clostridia bacterium]
MRILLVADEEAKYLWDYYQPGRLSDIDCILSCGDLKQEYLEFLVTMSGKPLYYVHGNHDSGYVNYPPEGCDCAEDTVINIGGLRVLGLGGCIRYNPGPYQYTEREMRSRIRRVSRRIKKAGGVDIVITHAPPLGYGDAPDNAHRGFGCFLKLMDEFHPKYLIHGHVHQSYGHRLPQSVVYGDTTVYNAVGWHILEIDAPDRADEKRRLGGLLMRLLKRGADT